MSEQSEQHEGHPVVAVGQGAGPGIRAAQQQAGEKSGDQDDGDDDGGPLADMVEEPAKVMRIGTMVKQLLEEVRAAPLDDKSRARMREIHETSIKELSEGLAPDLRDELGRIALPFEDDVPSDGELRVAHAQLVGWLEGLFHGIQTALFAQQMAARQQLQGMRRALPGGMPPGMQPPPEGGEQGPHPGAYL